MGLEGLLRIFMEKIPGETNPSFQVTKRFWLSEFPADLDFFATSIHYTTKTPPQQQVFVGVK